MASEVFVDTSGFYAMLVHSDDKHPKARRFFRDARRRKQVFLTTDYVLSETATLLKARGYVHLLPTFFDTLEESDACRIEWTDADSFQDVQTYFLKHADQEWSFTDCLSFRVMKRLQLREALTKDSHFEHAGFMALLR